MEPQMGILAKRCTHSRDLFGDPLQVVGEAALLLRVVVEEEGVRRIQREDLEENVDNLEARSAGMWAALGLVLDPPVTRRA